MPLLCWIMAKPGVKLMVVKFTSYSSDPRICVITIHKDVLSFHKMQTRWQLDIVH